MSVSGWIGVDLDGTLAQYGGYQGAGHIGDPVLAMLVRVQSWLAQGVTVKIVTARVSASNSSEDIAKAREQISRWCLREIGHDLEVVCAKDFAMVELWDDRAVAVEKNTGRILGGSSVFDGPKP